MVDVAQNLPGEHLVAAHFGWVSASAACLRALKFRWAVRMWHVVDGRLSGSNLGLLNRGRAALVGVQDEVSYKVPVKGCW